MQRTAVLVLTALDDGRLRQLDFAKADSTHVLVQLLVQHNRAVVGCNRGLVVCVIVTLRPLAGAIGRLASSRNLVVSIVVVVFLLLTCQGE